MINLNKLHLQHKAILHEVNLIESEVFKKNEGFNLIETAMRINRLDGHLKIHANEVDNLYPELLKCEDKEIQVKALQYMNEMGDLVVDYTKYRNSYNFSIKIKSKLKYFIDDTLNIMNALKLRIEKEYNELYNLIEMRNL